MKKFLLFIFVLIFLLPSLFSSWTKREDVDVFGDLSGKFVFTNIENGTCTSLEKEEENVILKIEISNINENSFMLYSSTFIPITLSNDFNLLIKDESGNVTTYKTKVNGEKISLGDNDFSSFITLLKNNSLLKIAIVNDDNRYNFTLNNSSFNSVIGDSFSFLSNDEIKKEVSEKEESISSVEDVYSSIMSINSQDSIILSKKIEYPEFSFTYSGSIGLNIPFFGKEYLKEKSNSALLSFSFGFNLENMCPINSVLAVGLKSDFIDVYTSSDNERLLISSLDFTLLFNTDYLTYYLGLGLGFGSFEDENENSSFSVGPDIVLGLEYNIVFFTNSIDFHLSYLPLLDNLLTMNISYGFGFRF